MDTSQIQQVKDFILTNWHTTIRQPSEQGAGEVPLPYPFLVPTAGAQFHIFFYWDTYFASEGLLRSGMEQYALYNCENYLYCIEKLGYMPNHPIYNHLNRSQPPVATALVRSIYEKTGDKLWLARAHATLQKEYAFWMTFRLAPNGLNHYGHHADPANLQQFYDVVKSRLVDIPEDPLNHLTFLKHAMAEAESGWDFTPRFSRRAADFNPVDLNGLLYMHEANAAFFCAELGDAAASLWQQRAARRLDLLNRYLWNGSKGFYYDYDYVRNEQSPVLSAAFTFALWGGAIPLPHAERIASNLSQLEMEYGLSTCAPGERPAGQTYQWDYPNLWPPLTFAAIAGFQRMGMMAIAHRLALKYIQLVCRNYQSTGNLWEKYNAITGGVDVSDEYAMPPMLGWTAGTFLYALEVLGL